MNCVSAPPALYTTLYLAPPGFGLNFLNRLIPPPEKMEIFESNNVVGEKMHLPANSTVPVWFYCYFASHLNRFLH